MNLFETIRALAAEIGSDVTLTVPLVFARIAQAGPDGMLQASIQRELNLPPAVLTRAVQTLVTLDLVAQTIDAADGRHRVLRITDKGAKLAGGTLPLPPKLSHA